MDHAALVYIFEDEKFFSASLEHYISEYLDAHGLQWEIRIVNRDFAAALAESGAAPQQNRIFFVDIILDDYNGLKLAQKIRDQDIRAYIIFVTSHFEYAFPAIQYKIRALDYILKNDGGMRSKIFQCLDTIVGEMAESRAGAEEQTLLIRTNGTYFIIPFQEIRYFETNTAKRSIILHTEDKKIEFRDTLDELQQRLDNSFYRCHRSYLINLQHVQSICRKRSDLHVLLDTGTKCLVSSRYLKGLLKYERNRT